MIYPKKIKEGSHIRVIAPSRSFSIISKECRSIALKRFEELGITISYSKNAEKIDDFESSSVFDRLDDLHEAFSDNSVDAILTAIGGYNTNQLIDSIDYNMIQKNPKILCGYSDITCLCHAITSQTNLVTYSGPHFSSFGMEKGFGYTLDYFIKCLFENGYFQVKYSKEWSDDMWFLDQKNRNFINNSGFEVLNRGVGDIFFGRLVGGHAKCMTSLQGTKYRLSLDNSILFLEEDKESNANLFDRLLQSIIHQNDFSGVKAICVGRFQKASKVDMKLLSQIVKSKEAIRDIPVIANCDFGHTNPIITYPIGGNVAISFIDKTPKIEIMKA